MSTLLLCHFVYLITYALAADSDSPFYPTVTLANGSPTRGKRVQTVTGKEVDEFLGVPFAEPPIGSRRFRPSVPKAAWTTVHDALNLPNSCVQTIDNYFENYTFREAQMWNANTPLNEDCL